MMLSEPFRALSSDIIKVALASPTPAQDPLRRDLTDSEYADWFLGDKIEARELKASYAINDFVLFRIAFSWPRQVNNWVLDSSDILNGDFRLSDSQANDLVDLAREGLTDGYVSAQWFAKVAAVWFTDKLEPMPERLFVYLQELLFLPPNLKKGRKRSYGIDRDRVIRNLFEGLLARGSGRKGLIINAHATIRDALFRKQAGMTDDAIRKICGRTKRTERETRYWALIYNDKSQESKA